MADTIELFDVDPDEFKSFIEFFTSKMDFDIKSMRDCGDGSIYVQAKTTNPIGGEIISLIRAGPYKKEVDVQRIKELEEGMLVDGAVRAAFITTSDFTGDALDYARGKPISLINRFQIVESLESRGVKPKDTILTLMKALGLTEKRFLGEDHIFLPGKKRDDVLDYFESKKREKRFLSRESPEKIEEIETKYAPVGMFKVTVSMDVEVENKSLGKIEHDDFLFVNLNNGDLYYLLKRRKSGSTEYSFESSQVLKEIFDLPKEAREHLDNLLDHGEIPYKHLDDKFAAILESAGIIKVYGKTYMLMHNPTLRNMINVIVYVTQELLDFVVLFIHSITGTEPGDIDRSLSHAEATPAESYAKASIDMPHLRGGIYDLKKFLVIKMVSGLKFKVDQIKYHSSDVSEFLESIFSAASVSPRGVLFMPYFVCTYRSLDVKGLRRREFLIAPKFIEEEDKEKEGKKAKKTVYGKPEGLKFDRVPYRVIK